VLSLSCCRPNLKPVGPAPDNQIIGAEEMTLITFVKNHRSLVWYLRTTANEQWVKFDLKRIFGVPSLEEGDDSQVASASGHRSYEGKRKRRRHNGGNDNDSDDSFPLRKPVHKLLGLIAPSTRQWATDKTDALVN